MDNLLNRIEKLEKSNRRMKIALSSFLATIICGAVVAIIKDRKYSELKRKGLDALNKR